MPIFPLIIGPNEHTKIAELRTFAEANPMDVRWMQEAAAEDLEAFRDMMQMHSLVLPTGFWVVYTHERQPNAPPPGICHHISISVSRAGMLPGPDAVEMILAEFGMKPLAQTSREAIWIEDVGPERKAISIVQLMDAYRDERCSERSCDHCGNRYRGPAVYCCLECAIADQ